MTNLFSEQSSWSKRCVEIWPILLVTALLVACGDDDSDFATRPSGDSSSNSIYRSGLCNVETDENCFKDDRDGQTYKIVTIEDQVWMAENLNYETSASYCLKDDATNCIKYGRLYTWVAALSACPDGWHLPSRSEWETLLSAVGGESTAGTKLKSTSGWNSSANGTDAYGFSALPAGVRNGDTYSDSGGYYAQFWSATEGYSGYAYSISLYHDPALAAEVGYGFNDENSGKSVRCLKD